MNSSVYSSISRSESNDEEECFTNIPEECEEGVESDDESNSSDISNSTIIAVINVEAVSEDVRGVGSVGVLGGILDTFRTLVSNMEQAVANVSEIIEEAREKAEEELERYMKKMTDNTVKRIAKSMRKSTNLYWKKSSPSQRKTLQNKGYSEYERKNRK